MNFVAASLRPKREHTENTKRTPGTQRGHSDTRKTQREHTERTRREHTERTQREHREKPERTHRENTE